MTWCRPRPCKSTRESCTHVSVRSRKLFPPASLPCRPNELRPAAADAQAVAVAGVKSLLLAVATTATREPARCCHRSCRWAAAGRDRQQATEGARDLADWPEEGGCSPHRSLTDTCSSAWVERAASSRELHYRLEWEPSCRIGKRVCICEYVPAAVSASCTRSSLPSSSWRDSSDSADRTGVLATSERERVSAVGWLI